MPLSENLHCCSPSLPAAPLPTIRSLLGSSSFMLEGVLLPSFPSIIMPPYPVVVAHWIFKCLWKSIVNLKQQNCSTQLWEIQTEIQLCVRVMYQVIMIGLKNFDDDVVRTFKIPKSRVKLWRFDRETRYQSLSARHGSLTANGLRPNIHKWSIVFWEGVGTKEITQFLRSFVLRWSEHLPPLCISSGCGFLSSFCSQAPLKFD